MRFLDDHALGRREQRWPALRSRRAEQAYELFAEQVALLDKQTPCSRERLVESGRPGALLR